MQSSIEKLVFEIVINNKIRETKQKSNHINPDWQVFKNIDKNIS